MIISSFHIIFCIINFISTIENWHTMKVYYDVSYLKNLSGSNDILKKIESYESYFIPLSNYFIQNIFKVREKQELTLKDLRSSCERFLKKYITVDINKIYEYDFFLAVLAENDITESYLGYANFCKTDKETNRPLVGYINFNLAHFSLDKHRYYEYFLTIFHEIMHAFGFSGDSVPLFVDNKLNSIAKTQNLFQKNDYTYLKSNNIIQLANKHFNCSSVEGIRFENDGSSGSSNHHWEKLDLGLDFMLATDTLGSKISDFTFAFFEDSGWFQINYKYTQKLLWGNQKGCDFLKSCNPKFKEFCDNGENCSVDFLHPTRCDTTSETGNCKVSLNRRGYCNIEPYDKIGDDYFGNDSRCLVKKEGSTFKSNCYKSYCTDNGKKIIFESVDLNKIECTQEGEFETGGITYVCPKIKEFCDLRYECKNSCSGNGICYNGHCICFIGYKGISCGIKNQDTIYSNCKDNCNENGICNNGTCKCFDNYNGEFCENIINDIGSFGSKCSESNVIKCFIKLDTSFINFSKKKILKLILSIFFIYTF